MAFKDILVHIDSSPHCAVRLSLAISLARQHQAHLTGLYVISHPYYKPHDGSAELGSASAQKFFERETAQAGMSAEWLCVDWGVSGISVTEVVTMYSYNKDLVVVGQTEPGAPVDDIQADLPERVAKGAGRPVLIVPFSGRFDKVGERVMIAWRSGRESVRALNDAMSFLEKAEHVSVVEVGSTAGEGEHRISGADVCTHLNRHGVEAKAENIAAEIPIGDVLINQAWEEGFDLLVMGAYTNTPRGTLELGAVAEHVLGHMSVPVLISH
jgi:nucleotide-binding universal stress UspA family protein